MDGEPRSLAGEIIETEDDRRQAEGEMLAEVAALESFQSVFTDPGWPEFTKLLELEIMNTAELMVGSGATALEQFYAYRERIRTLRMVIAKPAETRMKLQQLHDQLRELDDQGEDQDG